MSSQRSIKILFLGDIVGKPGRRVVKNYLSARAKSGEKPDLVIANAENASHGYGITESNIAELKEAGIDVFTGGNHTFDRKDTVEFIDKHKDLLRPANYPEGTPGAGWCVIDINGHKLGIINLMGRVFMEPLSSPFLVADQLIEKIKEQTNLIFVDVHAEATAEKVALGHYLDGRVSALVGTHTHVQTADERILPGGTAYITDAGCCAPINGVIGMDCDGAIRRMVKQLPTRLEVAGGPAQVNGVVIELDVSTGKAIDISRVKHWETDEEAKES